MERSEIRPSLLASPPESPLPPSKIQQRASPTSPAAKVIQPPPPYGPNSEVKKLTSTPSKALEVKQELQESCENDRESDDEEADDIDPFQDAESVIKPVVMTDNPFENEHSKILFEAIDKLQSLGAHKYVSIPQLVIVGSQSAGKSSLLQTLTGIPFPTASKRCTRYPIHIVSRRTQPGTKNSYCISIEEPRVKVGGLARASDKALEYHESGENLTEEEFQAILQRVAYEQMGIRPGRGPGKVNFVGNVLRVELCGPQRSYFSIVDLPGVYLSSHDTNDEEVEAVRDMVVEYMRMEETVVICVVDARSDIATQGLYSLSISKVQRERLVGVFTKCDIPLDRDQIVSLSTGKNTSESDLTMHNGWFVVWNHKHADATGSNGPRTEDDLFNSHPWNAINKNRRGSKALKVYLANVLSTRIRNAFPNLISSISKQLDDCVAENFDMGPARDTLPAQQQFLMATVHKYRDQVNLALNRPGHFEDGNKELRKTVKELNEQYDVFMRHFGHCWEFEAIDRDPKDELINRLEIQSHQGETKLRAKHSASQERLEEIAGFYGNRTNDILGYLPDEIIAKLPKFQANQLPGVINPDIYPAMYHEQTRKWNKIAQLHLEKVADSVWSCVDSILTDTCPPSDGTRVLNEGLQVLLEKMFKNTFNAARQRLEEYCKREEQPTLLQTTDPRFQEGLKSWRHLRFLTAFLSTQSLQGDGVDQFLSSFELLHSSTTQNMVNDVHDVLKIYYGLALESFIRHVTSTIVEEFVSHSEGPLEGLTMKMILELSEEAINTLAMEDEQTVIRRKSLMSRIEGLTAARDLAETARRRTRKLTASA